MKTTLVFNVALIALLFCGCVSSQHSRSRNKAVIHRYFDAWANHGDTKAADELMVADLTLHNPPITLHSLEEYKQGMAAFHAAFPDLHFTVEEMLAEGNEVLVRWTMRGTQKGVYYAHAATGKTVEISGMSLFRLANGKIHEITVNMDRLKMWQQLGWMPEAAATRK